MVSLLNLPPRLAESVLALVGLPGDLLLLSKTTLHHTLDHLRCRDRPLLHITHRMR